MYESPPLSMRDYFAARFAETILGGITARKESAEEIGTIAEEEKTTVEIVIATQAYKLSDAMLLVR